MPGSFRIFRVFHADVRLHWSLPLGLVLFVLLWQPATARDLALALIMAGLLFVSVLVHELGHSLVAQSCGATTLALVLWPLGGVAVLEKPRLQAWQDIAITAAGPLANLGLAAFAWLALALAGALPPDLAGRVPSIFGYAQLAGDALVWMNVALAVFNLLPVYPLDGAQIVRRVLVSTVGEPWATRVLLWLSTTLVLGMLLWSLLGHDPLLGASALLIGMGALTLNYGVSQWFATLFTKRPRQ